jgi:hypothetical protein
MKEKKIPCDRLESIGKMYRAAWGKRAAGGRRRQLATLVTGNSRFVHKNKSF